MDTPGSSTAAGVRPGQGGAGESELESIGSYSVVEQSPEVGLYSPSESGSLVGSRSVVPSPTPSTPLRSSSVAAVPQGRVVLTWAEREAICGDIAAFLVRCRTGQQRGTSGRDRINLPSRVWLVCRDFEGQDFDPVRIYKVFALCKDLVKRGADCGQSIFVGLPSEREARFVVALAGLRWPEQ